MLLKQNKFSSKKYHSETKLQLYEEKMTVQWKEKINYFKLELR
jgi:hypothetical protein